MRKVFRWMLAAGLICLAAAPALADDPAVDTKNADYGRYPTDSEALVQAWGAANLRDPDSAKYVRFSKPRKEYAFNNGPIYGFSVCAAINSKNGYGGYSGPQTYWFFIRDGQVLRGQNTATPIAGVIPGVTISRGHFVNCTDGDADGN